MTISRKDFLASSAVASVAVVTVGPESLVRLASLPFATGVKVGNINNLTIGQPVYIHYPDKQALAILVKLGRPAIGGVGPDGDIVAFSAYCTHMGSTVGYKSGRFVCPTHFSMFDPAKNGEVYQGLAVEYLPQIRLHVLQQTGDIYAQAIDGLIWGRVTD